MASTASGKQAGCFKCGQIGHWGSQCTAQPSQRVGGASGQTNQGATGSASPSAGLSGTPRQLAAGSQNSQRQPAGATACFKCGKTGHWSRDCPAAPDNQSPQAVARARTSQITVQPGVGEQTAAQPQGENTEPPEAAGVKRKTRPKRPKVELEDLLKPDAIPAVLHTMSDTFRKVYKGPGHEARDLRALLGLYEGWGRSVAPATPYDQFLNAVEKIGQTAALKKHLQEMRQTTMATLAPSPRPRADSVNGREEDAQSDRERGATANTAAAPDEMDFDDDDFNDLLGQDAWAPASAPAAPMAAAAAANDDDMDDFDLADLVAQPNSVAPGAQEAADDDGYNPEEDDQLCDLMGLGSEEQQPSRTETPHAVAAAPVTRNEVPSEAAAAAAAAPSPGDYDFEEDDDLCELMGMDVEEPCRPMPSEAAVAGGAASSPTDAQAAEVQPRQAALHGNNACSEMDIGGESPRGGTSMTDPSSTRDEAADMAVAARTQAPTMQAAPTATAEAALTEAATGEAAITDHNHGKDHIMIDLDGLVGEEGLHICHPSPAVAPSPGGNDDHTQSSPPETEVSEEMSDDDLCSLVGASIDDESIQHTSEGDTIQSLPSRECAAPPSSTHHRQHAASDCQPTNDRRAPDINSLTVANSDSSTAVEQPLGSQAEDETLPGSN